MKTKYDWSNVPKEVKWIAKEPNGKVFGYIPKAPQPVFISHTWQHFNEVVYLKDLRFDGNWESSLEERPND